MDESNSAIGILSLLALIAFNALLSTAHSSLVNVHKPQLRELAEKGNQRAQRVLDLSENSTRLLASRQFMNLLLHFFTAGIVTIVIAQPLIAALQDRGVATLLVRIAVYAGTWALSAPFVIIFGELIPENLASRRAESLAMLMVGPMTFLMRITSPLWQVALWFGKRLSSPFNTWPGATYVTEEEIKTLVDAGSEEGVIENEEKEMIYSIFEFSDKVAREVMIPRIDIVAVDANTSLQQAIDLVLAKGHSRLPVYEGNIDRVCGLLYAKDLLNNLHTGQGQDRPVREVMRPAYFIPESKKAGALLQELQERKIHMAIIIDEYGGTAGLVTIEDLLEEIVGEIQDEYDYGEEDEYEKISDDEYLFDAGISVGDVNNLLDVKLSTEDSDTLGGFVFATLGKVPLVGEMFKVDNLEIKVEMITGRRILKVRIRRLPPPAEPQPDTTVEAEVNAKPVEAEVSNPKALNAGAA